MPRRNQREQYEPLDLTPARSNVPPLPYVQRKPPETRQEREARQIQQQRRQETARINGGIDWDVCLVPGCGRQPLHLRSDGAEWRDHNVNLPLCISHISVAYEQAVLKKDEPLLVDAVARVVERREAKEETLAEARRKAWLARTDGDIYFVRLNELIKVGWTRDLPQRIKAYGASAVLLVTYPGTRDDETNLHRQLAPTRAKGREWYEDGPIVHAFIDKALAQYGMPPVLNLWTEPKRVVAGKRH